ncbi:2-aminoadipate transaminase [Sporolactobacillus nakayamae]|uniref:2-aminoadipate transaminase n=2 Tax=Sporolactobacillus nakayamae TaxID=269670 RepID=A0A1I2TNU2_9BACL|nr:PLP-dependent aminotransferase family protein [Sporolactobacillus sp. STSJ-5]MCQ2010224.1 PLP-dependent aminotransferase family protein [Sporolactobacillus sp. STSJ-5]SFG66564.1 2-aminoadipate transaminase [Sporolactobacillus nakayamae]
MMKLNFSECARSVSNSATREILKVTEQPEIISFAGGLPAPELFPVAGIKAACEAVLDEAGEQALQYSTTEGYLPLREAIAERMRTLGIVTTPEHLLVLTGSQQGLDLTGKLFLDKGDVVICESPTYLAAINAFKAYSPRFVEVPMDDGGMRMDELELALQANPNAKFIYTIPDFQNPTGRTMKLERRKKLVELANQYNIVILEDNPYGAIRFVGKDLPPVKHFDTEGRVIYLSTFSKIFAPGLRLGWICADESILNKYVAFKQATDLHTDSFAQRVTAKYMELFDLEEHIQKIKGVYRARREKMMECIDAFFPKQLKHSAPEGGLFIWVELPEEINVQNLFKKCLDNKVAFVPGDSFFPNDAKINAFRLNYSNMSEEKIVEGMKRIGNVLNETLMLV